jgi:hypothetical protein
MVQVIGSAIVTGAISAASALAGLEAQLARYQKQLSECVNCDSSKTTEGKAQIQSISSIINDVRARIDKVTGVDARSKTSALTSSTAIEVNNNGAAATPTSKINGDVRHVALIAFNLALGGIGSNVDVLA